MCTCPAFEAAGFDELQATINCQIENNSAAYVFERETCSCVYTPPSRIYFGFSGCGLYSTLETDLTYPAYDYRIEAPKEIDDNLCSDALGREYELR